MYSSIKCENWKSEVDNHKHTLLGKKLRSSYLSNFAFGASAMIFSFIPIFNLIIIPAAVAGATLKFLEENNS